MWKQLLNWRKGGSWKNLEVHARKIDVSGEGSEGKEESWRESFHFLSKHINNHEQSVGRNMDGKVHFVEVLEGNEEHAVGQWRTDDPCYKVAKNLAELCPSVFARYSWRAMKMNIQ